ncbi:Uncharacterised protein [Escherichia coli]|uniref:Uncharacterized protein n=1 Tax=Escherichia coli TaxID=562 RepID=A0A376TJW0_ECOLX|nr:Uncharacterised protein [Escherichia coli]
MLPNLEIVHPTIFFRHFDIQCALNRLIKVVNDKWAWWGLFFW